MKKKKNLKSTTHYGLWLLGAAFFILLISAIAGDIPNALRSPGSTAEELSLGQTITAQEYAEYQYRERVADNTLLMLMFSAISFAGAILLLLATGIIKTCEGLKKLFRKHEIVMET